MTEITSDQFKRIRDSYWVLADKREIASGISWLFGIGDDPPRPAVNPNYVWRRPTYEEAVIRQERWERDPLEFDLDTSEFSLRIRYRRETRNSRADARNERKKRMKPGDHYRIGSPAKPSYERTCS